MSAFPCGCDPTHKTGPYLCEWHRVEWEKFLASVTVVQIGQTKRRSLLESYTSVSIGYSISLLIQIYLYPLMGIEITLSQNMIAVGIFTAVSIIRSYWVRRMFNHLEK